MVTPSPQSPSSATFRPPKRTAYVAALLPVNPTTMTRRNHWRFDFCCCCEEPKLAGAGVVSGEFNKGKAVVLQHHVLEILIVGFHGESTDQLDQADEDHEKDEVLSKTLNTVTHRGCSGLCGRGLRARRSVALVAVLATDFFACWAAKSFDDLSQRIEWWLRSLPMTLPPASSPPVGLGWGCDSARLR
jgi:hypothetical protein